jgi:hypothetical protein
LPVRDAREMQIMAASMGRERAVGILRRQK